MWPGSIYCSKLLLPLHPALQAQQTTCISLALIAPSHFQAFAQAPPLTAPSLSSLWPSRSGFPSEVFSWCLKSVSEKAMAPHSSTLAWEIPWMEEPGRLQSMGLLRVRHNWATSLSLFTFMHWRRKWQPTPVFLPGESQEQRSLVGCRLWGRTESDTTEVT